MSGGQDEALALLQALKLDFIGALNDGLTGILAAWEDLLADPKSRERRDALEMKAHSLAGNSGIFGLSAIAEAASGLEASVAAGFSGGDGADEIALLGAAVARALADSAGLERDVLRRRVGR